MRIIALVFVLPCEGDDIMPQNVLVSVLGEGEYLQKLIRAILEKEVVPQRNLFVSARTNLLP